MGERYGKEGGSGKVWKNEWVGERYGKEGGWEKGTGTRVGGRKVQEYANHIGKENKDRTDRSAQSGLVSTIRMNWSGRTGLYEPFVVRRNG